MPRATGIGMPKKKSKSKPSSKPAAESPPEPTDLPEPVEIPSPRLESTPIDACAPSPAKLMRQAGIALVKEKRKIWKSANKKHLQAIDACKRICEREEKRGKVLERPRPPRVLLPLAKRAQEFGKCEARMAKAIEKVDCHAILALEAKEELYCMIMACKNVELKRLRALLRKHNIPWGI